MELWAVRERQLPITDPLGRMLTISCGAALHHARLALAAEGWQIAVERVPRDDANLLARIEVIGRVPATPEAMRLLQTARIRHTDRRPVSSIPVESTAIESLRRTADAEGAHLHVLRDENVADLAAAAARAQAVEDLDMSWRQEMRYWAGGGHAPGVGLPDEVIPATQPAVTVADRDFGHGGTLPVSEEHDRAAAYAILYGDEDAPPGWLRGGEALSAIWLVAIENRLSVLPLSAVIEVAETRHQLRRMLSDLGEPYLAIRLGVPDPDHAGPPHTPRLPADQVVDIVKE
jgi:nitroreductase